MQNAKEGAVHRQLSRPLLLISPENKSYKWLQCSTLNIQPRQCFIFSVCLIGTLSVWRTESLFCTFFFCLKFLKGFEWCFAVCCFSASCRMQSAASQQIHVSDGSLPMHHPLPSQEGPLKWQFGFSLLLNSLYLQNPFFFCHISHCTE